MRKYIDGEILMNRVKNKKSIRDIRENNRERLIALHNQAFIESYTTSMLNSLEVGYSKLGVIRRIKNRDKYRELRTYINSLTNYYLHFIKRTIMDIYDHDMFDITDILSTIVAYNNDIVEDWDCLDEVLTDMDFYIDDTSLVVEDKLLGYKYLFLALCIYSRVYSCSTLISRIGSLIDVHRVTNEIAKRYKLSGLENSFIEIIEHRMVSEKNIPLVLDVIDFFETLVDE